MPKTYDRPGSAYDRNDKEDHGGPETGKNFGPQASPGSDKYDPRGELDQAERGSGADGAGADAGPVGPGGLKDSEESGLYRPDDDKAAGSTRSSGLYNDRGDKQGRFSRLRNRTKNARGNLLQRLSSRKWVAGGLVAGIALVGLIAIILLLVAGAYKIVDFAENVAAYQFARVTRQMADNTDAITAEKIGVDVADQTTFDAIKAKYGEAAGNVKDLWSKFDKYRPQQIISNFDRDGVLTFNYRDTKLGRQVLDSVTINGEEVAITRGTVKNLIPGYKFAKNISFSRDFAPNLNEALAANDIGPITRARVASQIRDELDIGLVAWVTGRFAGKTDAAADLEVERESAAAAEGKQLTFFDNGSVETEAVSGGASSGLDGAATDVKDKLNNSLADDKKAAAIVENPNETPADVATALEKDASSVAANGLQGAIGGLISKALGLINPVYKYAVPLCLIYDGSIQKSGPTIDSQSQQLERSAVWVQSASAQQKTGYHADPEAVAATNWKLQDITKSNSEIRASGQPINTNTTLSTEASPTGQYTYTIADYLGPIGNVIDSIGPVCPALTNIWVGVGLGAANIAAQIASLFTGGEATAAEAGGEAAVDAELDAQLSLFDASEYGTAAADSSSFLSRVVTKSKASASFAKDFTKDTAKQVVTIGALTLLARQLVTDEMGSSYSPTSVGKPYDNGIDNGTNIYANEIDQKQFYGAPMSDSSLTQDNNANTQSLALKQSRQSTFDRYLAVTNPNSLLSRAAVTSSGYLNRSFFSSLLKLGSELFNPLRSLASAFSPVINKASFADTPVTSVNNYYGNLQFGYTPREQGLIHDKNLTYGDLLANQAALDKSGKESAINSKYKDCFTKSIGELLSSGDVKRDKNGNVLADGSLCSPKSLGPNNPKYGDLVFRWRLAHNYSNTLDQLTQEQEVTSSDDDTGSGGSSALANGFANPFPDGWTPGRLDMGYDGHFTNQIVSPCDGTMAFVNADSDHGSNGGWEGAFFTVKCSQKIPDLPSSDFYFAEGVTPTVHQGQSVTAGQQIGKPGWTGYSEGPGGIEWGLADPSDPGNALAIRSQAGCPSSGTYRSMVLSFNQWVVDNLNVKGYDKSSSSNSPGCA